MSTSVNMQTVLSFLSDLQTHNDKAWFNQHRDAYDAAREEFEALVSQLIGDIGRFDDLTGLAARECIMRIYRDVRFSKDKSPFRTSMAASITRGGKWSTRLGYYLNIQPGGESFVGGGLYQPDPAWLARFREAISYNSAPFKAILNAPKFKRRFGTVQGDAVKTAPQGYPKDHPEIELLRQKDVLAMHNLADEAVLATDFSKHVVDVCKAMKPFLDYLNALSD